MSKFLLLLGPSGVGKSTIIDDLSKLDSRFVYVSPYMTRPLRPGEKNKISISHEEMNEMDSRGEFLVINELYGGIRYGTPKLPIVNALSAGNFPVLDWPIDRLEIMTSAFPGQLFIVYVSPPSLDVLRQRLANDGRDAGGTRIAGAERELEKYWSGDYDGSCDLAVVSEENQTMNAACVIRDNCLKSLR